METILKEETFDVCGTTKLTVGDPMYLRTAKRNLYSMVPFPEHRSENFGSVRSIVSKMVWSGMLWMYLYFRQVNCLCSKHI